jgi:hypothetical protein
LEVDMDQAETRDVVLDGRPSGAAETPGAAADVTASAPAPPPPAASASDAGGGRGGPVVDPPPRSASFAEKMEFYRSQHTTRGIRLTHLFGIPGVAASIPMLFVAPRRGVPLFVGSWVLQVAGHKVFEKNNPALTRGFFTYQFCGLAFWCEEMVDLLAGRGILTPEG